MKSKLEEYVNGNVNYIPIVNYLVGDIFSNLGKYAYEKVFNEKLPKQFKYFEQFFKKSFLTKIDIFSKKEKAYYSLAIILLTSSDLVIDQLKKIYGEPIYHNEFGEGFDGEYDNDNDIESEPLIKESFASYFITIDGVDLHVGYDHRGLTIEVEKGTSDDDLMKSLKTLIYIMYKK